MTPSNNLHSNVASQVLGLLAGPTADPERLNNALRILCKHRSHLIQNTILKECGTNVQTGPFAGMKFNEKSSEGCHIPKLLGCYEEELHDQITRLPSADYDVILNIGCAEGYYAVGMKRTCPDTRVLAFDIDPKAQQACRELAERNGVAIEVGGRFAPADFDRFKDLKVLVWCDIEGAEIDMLTPDAAPALRGMDIVVELHQTPRGHTRAIVPQRFAGTHEIEIRTSRGHNPLLPLFLQNLGHLDQLLAQWEWRSTPTPWALMTAKNRPLPSPA